MCRSVRSHSRHLRAELWAQCKPHLFILAGSRNVIYFIFDVLLHAYALFMCVCVSVWVGGGHRSMSSVFLHYSPHFFFETSFLSKPRAQQFRQTGWLVSPGIFLSLSPRCWEYKHLLPCLAFLHGFLASKLRSLAYAAIPVLTDGTISLDSNIL